MPQPSASDDSHLTSKVERILSGAGSDEEMQTAVDELFQFLCENPRTAATGAPKVQCAVAIDSGNECIVEIVSDLLPAEWRPRTTVAAFDGIADVIRMVRDSKPTLLVIHTNLLIRPDVKGIAGCVAVSPGTRYLIMTGWSEESVAELRKSLAPLQVPIDVLYMPFDRQQLSAALGSDFAERRLSF